MILVTGGLGFIGSHVTRALLDLGESCVLAQRRAGPVPDFLAGEVGSRLVIEQVDVADRAAFQPIGGRHPVTGIVHLASGGIGVPDPIGAVRRETESLCNVLQAARDWQLPRVCLASTIGVYGGAGEGVLREDLPLPLSAAHQIPAFKKSNELLAGYLASATGIEVVNLRIAAIWGPLGRPASPFFAAPQLVHAAVTGRVPESTAPHGRARPAYAGNGSDLCYVRDCGRAIALLQTAGKLSHTTYNVATGRVTSNQDIARAITDVIPGARPQLLPGRDPAGPGQDICLDVTRLRDDTGYRPEYGTQRAVADYVSWLRAGHER
jgi:UDP-glucose 4-epimerase